MRSARSASTARSVSARPSIPREVTVDVRVTTASGPPCASAARTRRSTSASSPGRTPAVSATERCSPGTSRVVRTLASAMADESSCRVATTTIDISTDVATATRATGWVSRRRRSRVPTPTLPSSTSLTDRPGHPSQPVCAGGARYPGCAPIVTERRVSRRGAPRPTRPASGPRPRAARCPRRPTRGARRPRRRRQRHVLRDVGEVDDHGVGSALARGVRHHEPPGVLVVGHRDVGEAGGAVAEQVAAQAGARGVPLQHPPVVAAGGLVPVEHRRVAGGGVLRVGHGVLRPAVRPELGPPPAADRVGEHLVVEAGEELPRRRRRPLLAHEDHRRGRAEQVERGPGGLHARGEDAGDAVAGHPVADLVVGLQVAEQASRVEVVDVDRAAPRPPAEGRHGAVVQEPAGQHLGEHAERAGLVAGPATGEVGVVAVRLAGQGHVQRVVHVVVPLGRHPAAAVGRRRHHHRCR